MHTTRDTDHGQAVATIDNALEQLTAALDAEQAAREASPDDLAQLKFPIKLGSGHHKPYDFVTKWRIWARSSGLLKGGE